MMLHLPEFHRRESKPVWRQMFDRAKQEVSELKDDIACIGGAHRVPGKLVGEKGRSSSTYRFELDQGTKIAVGDWVLALQLNICAHFRQPRTARSPFAGKSSSLPC